MDTQKRSIAKTITFRILATIATIILVVVFTGDWSIAGVIGGLEIISKLVLYYFHERVWEKIDWGQKHS